MTVYGDLQVSIIDELPPGRKPVQTIHYSIQRRATINQFIELTLPHPLMHQRDFGLIPLRQIAPFWAI